MTPPPQTVLHLARCAGRQGYGVGAIAVALAGSQGALGWNATTWSTDSEREIQEVSESGDKPPRMRGFRVLGPRRLGLSPKMLSAARGTPGSEFSVVHQHSLWSASGLVASTWRRRWNRPVVIAPHGTLDPWVLRSSRLKKALAMSCYERKNLRGAACLHATGEQEIDAFRSVGLENPIALIPNGVSAEWMNSRGDSQRFCEAYGLCRGERIMLYLSRVTPKKGLSLLLHAIAKEQRTFKDWRLVIAGPDELGHTAELKRLANELGVNESVTFIGPIFGNDRRDAFEAAELCVLPTHSEGNPMVVYESLAVATPVLTTYGAPCPFIREEGCGWWSEISVEGVQEGLQQLCSLSADGLRTMGQRGQVLCQDRYTWEAASKKTIELYEWLLGHRAKPEFVSYHGQAFTRRKAA